MTATDHEGLQQALDESPGDIVSRLALADAYEESRDEARAAFHRDLARMGKHPVQAKDVDTEYWGRAEVRDKWWWWRGDAEIAARPRSEYAKAIPAMLGMGLPTITTPRWFYDGHATRRDAEEFLFEAWGVVRLYVVTEWESKHGTSQ